MAGVKYRGLSPQTKPLRWVLFLLAVIVVIIGTGPAVVSALADWIGVQSQSLAWYSSRLLGFGAYGALALSVIYGLLLSSGILDAIAHRAVSLTLHQDLSAVAIGLTALHGALLALDTFVPQTVRQLVIPFSGPFRPTWVGVGQVAFYLMLVVYGSFYVRRQMGQRGWRLLHYTTLLAFAGATLHGVLTGTDTPTAWATWTYVGASAAVTFLLLYRIVLGLFEPHGKRIPAFERSEML
jgi:methionine sulfoxide reductase heme-binding subunit